MIRLRNVRKVYHTGDEKVHALKGVDLTFSKAEFVSVLGPSGCGKTTLLNIIGGLDRYTSGDFFINGNPTNQFKDLDWDHYRNHQVGFIFQSYNLIDHLSILGNVEIALSLSGIHALERRKRAKEVLTKVGLQTKYNKKPSELSNGQLQRVAIARALVNNPHIILADEPTGALDTENSIQIMKLLKELSKDKLVIMVTHNVELAESFSDRIIHLLDGEVQTDEQIVDTSRPLVIEEKRQKHTYMGIFTSMKLSFFNLIKKFGKTITSTIAGGIGVVGVGLVFGISIGFSQYVSVVQVTANTTTPVVVENKTRVEAFPDPDNPPVPRPKPFPANQFYITSQQTQPPVIYQEVINFINTEYLQHIENMNKDWYNDIKYYYDMTYPTFLLKDSTDAIRSVNYSTSTTADIGEIPYEDHEYLAQMFDILYGKLPSNIVSRDRIAEGVIVISDRNQLPDVVLNRLGFNGNNYEQHISFDELLNMELKIAHSGVVYEENPNTNLFVRRANQDIYNDERTMTLKIVGILRRKQNATIPQYQGIRYTSAVNRFILNETKEAPVVVRQQEILNDFYDNAAPLKSVLTGQSINENEANRLLRQLGIEQDPSRIVIYHKDSQAKELIVEYLQSYNEGRDRLENIIANAVGESNSNIVDTTLRAVNVVMVLIASVALFVSISLVSILSYLSVVERTPEIGILRSIGARKFDIFSVFSAESILIGIFSGIFGLILLYAITPSINTLFEAGMAINNIIKLGFPQYLFIFSINILLSLIVGVIPAIIASRKDPIKALKSTL